MARTGACIQMHRLSPFGFVGISGGENAANILFLCFKNVTQSRTPGWSDAWRDTQVWQESPLVIDSCPCQMFLLRIHEENPARCSVFYYFFLITRWFILIDFFLLDHWPSQFLHCRLWFMAALPSGPPNATGRRQSNVCLDVSPVKWRVQLCYLWTLSLKRKVNDALWFLFLENTLSLKINSRSAGVRVTSHKWETAIQGHCGL